MASEIYTSTLRDDLSQNLASGGIHNALCHDLSQGMISADIYMVNPCHDLSQSITSGEKYISSYIKAFRS
jgi:hypothetical protein